MTTLEIRAPEEQTEGTRLQVLRWLKAVGDAVAEHEPLIEIETDKVTVEVAAPASGVLREILKGESEEVAPGEVLGRLELEGAAHDVGAGTRAETQGGGVATAAAAPGAEAEGQHAAAGGERTGAQADSSECLPLTADAHAGRPLGEMSPAVRRLIAERGIDLNTIRGTGPGGRITVDDVLSASGEGAASSPQAAHSRTETSASSTASSAPSPRTSASSPETSASSPQTGALSADRSSTTKSPSKSPAQPTRDVPGHLVPHSAIRKRIADHMVQSLLQTAPHVTTVFEADLSAVIAHRAAHKADFESRGAPLTFTAYFLSAAAGALRAVPEANSRWTDSALELYDVINIGVATAIEDVGLVVPVVRAVESKDLFEIAERLNALVSAARAGKLQPADVRGGTFTISNHGVSGSLLAAPIVINQPQSAILGIGKLEKRVTISEDEQMVVRPKCYVTLTIDHRVMDGHRANQFLQTFVRALETWPAR